MLTDRAKDSVKTYSGGMKRRVNLGCALLHRPQLLLLDEPTVGIDPQARLNILEFIRQLCASGTAILHTTHYLEEAETLCQLIGIIDHGRLLAEGPLGELRERLGGDRRSSDRHIRSGQPADGGGGRMLVAAGNRTAGSKDHRALHADRLGNADPASTDQLRQRIRRRRGAVIAKWR
jgi:ABC-type multidrug transport system ATPase subunit